MDKAKAYDEALERARKQRDEYQKELDKTDKNSQLADILRAGISAVEMIFPQLEESDDERIRKDIIDHFESIKSRALYDNQEESDNIISSCNEKIAYLEKQQEASKAIEAIKRIDNYIDENVTNAHDMKDSLPDKKYCQGIDDTLADIARILQDVYSGEKQKEQESIPNTYGCLNCTKLEECKKGLTPCSGHRLEIVESKPVDIAYISEIREELLGIENNAKDIDGLTENQWVAIRAAHRLLGEYVEKEQKSSIFPPGFGEVRWNPISSVQQKPREWSEEDEKRVKQLIYDTEHIRAEYEKRKKELGESFNDELIKDCDEQIAWLKDISLNHKKFIEAVDKLWSNEWSEEDKKTINDACCFLGEYAGYIGSKNWGKSSMLFSIVDKLKSLYPIKQEWNEEDEEIWFALVTFFKGYLQKYPPLCKDEKAQANRILKWLNTTIKSFRLHYRWKPSKEKMDALKNVAYGTYQNGDGPALRELYEQLLKLGVKEEPEYYQHFDPDC